MDYVRPKQDNTMIFQIPKITLFISNGAKALLIAATLPACASLRGHFKQVDSPLPIETVHASAGQIANARAFESSDKLYVTGSMQRGYGYALHYAGHVDVQLVDPDGRVVAEKLDDIESSGAIHERMSGMRYRYVASFPLGVARQAAKIRMTYHPAEK